MKLLRGDADLGAEAKHAAVREARRGVDVNRRGVHAGEEGVGGRDVARDDALGVVRREAVDVVDGLVGAGDHVRGEVERAVLGGPVGLRGGDDLLALAEAGHERGREHLLVGVECHAPVGAGAGQLGQELVGHGGVDEHRLDGVADARALRLGVLDDVERHGEVGRGLHVDVAVALPRLDDRHAGLLDAGADERVAAARDEHVDEAVGMHELDGLGAVGVLDEGGAVGRQARGGDADAAGLGDGHAGVVRGGAAPQHAGIAGAQREADGVGRDVGARLVDHGHDTQRHADAREPDARGQRAATHDLADGVCLRGDLAHGRDDAVDAGVVEHETVEEGRRHAVLATALHVGRVGREYLGPERVHLRRRSLDGHRALLRRRLSQHDRRGLGRLRLLQSLRHAQSPRLPPFSLAQVYPTPPNPMQALPDQPRKQEPPPSQRPRIKIEK